MRIVLIDDDELTRETLQEVLESAGYEVDAAPEGGAGLARCKEQSPDLVITDLIMPGKEGMETIVELRRDFPAVPIIAISGGSRIGPGSYLHTAVKLGASSGLEKPFSPGMLLDVVQTTLNLQP